MREKDEIFDIITNKTPISLAFSYIEEEENGVTQNDILYLKSVFQKAARKFQYFLNKQKLEKQNKKNYPRLYTFQSDSQARKINKHELTLNMIYASIGILDELEIRIINLGRKDDQEITRLPFSALESLKSFIDDDYYFFYGSMNWDFGHDTPLSLAIYFNFKGQYKRARKAFHLYYGHEKKSFRQSFYTQEERDYAFIESILEQNLKLFHEDKYFLNKRKEIKEDKFLAYNYQRKIRRNSVQEKIKFGKYKGMLLSELIINKPSYLIWCIKNLTNFQICFHTLFPFIVKNKLQDSVSKKLLIYCYLKNELVSEAWIAHPDAVDYFNTFESIYEGQGHWGGLYDEEAYVGYWNTH